jgi:two-component system response regulator AtoC
LERCCVENDRKLCQISKDSESLLLAYAWPGNVRELENMMERAVVLASKDEEELTPSHLPISLRRAA